jgi:hypothetical protein
LLAPPPSGAPPRQAHSQQPSGLLALPATSKVLRWWQDPAKTFGEPGLLDTLGSARLGSKAPAPSFGAGSLPSAAASSLHTSAKAQQRRPAAAAERAGANEKAGERAAREDMPAPLKKRARYSGSCADDGAQSSEVQPGASGARSVKQPGGSASGPPGGAAGAAGGAAGEDGEQLGASAFKVGRRAGAVHARW